MANAFTRALRKTGNKVADALPQWGATVVNNDTDPTSALNMLRRKSAAAGPPGKFRFKK